MSYVLIWALLFCLLTTNLAILVVAITYLHITVDKNMVIYYDYCHDMNNINIIFVPFAFNWKE